MVVVLTKFDILEHNVEREVLRTKYQRHRVNNVLRLPQEEQAGAMLLIEQECQARISKIKQQWKDEVGRHNASNQKALELTFQFVSIDPPLVDTSIPELKQASKRAMTGDRMTQMHKEAQKNWIDNTLIKAINTLVDHWANSRSLWKVSLSNSALQKSIRFAIKKINDVFEYEGFKSASHPNRIMEHLHSSQLEYDIWPIMYTGFIIVGGVIIRSIPLGAVATLATAAASTLATTGASTLTTTGASTLATAAASTVKNARDLALNLIPELVHVLLIFERIYWYHGGNINDQFIDGSCHYYLKIQTQVIKRIMEIQGWRMLTAMASKNWEKKVVRDILERVTDEFRFKHNPQKSQTPEPLNIQPIPAEFIGG